VWSLATGPKVGGETLVLSSRKPGLLGGAKEFCTHCRILVSLRGTWEGARAAEEDGSS
jgi:hypothetical protein